MNTSKKVIHTSKAPDAIGPYSQAIQIEKTVYISGQIPLIPETMELAGSNIQEQAHQVLKNLRAICFAAGGDLNALVKIQIYLTDLNNFQTVNSIMQEYFSAPFPARATLEVSKLPKESAIEIDGIMVLN